MLEIVKKRITLTKGDDGSIWLRPKYKDQSVYEVQEGDRAYFRIKTTTDTLELECNVNVDANKIVVSFVPDDTKDMLPGIYRYEAELVTSWGMHYTFLADQTFILGKELEKHVSNANTVNGNYGNNIPSVDGELEDEPVVDGDLQPTNPSLDYETLNHLPKINGHTLRGDMSNEDLGIPTALADMTDDEEHRVVTDEQISNWNNKVEDDNYVHTDNNYDDTAKNAVDALGTASTYDVPESGNASTSQVVKGDDTRLTDSRNPNPHTHSKADITDFPTNVSAFNNDSGFITNTVNNLANYYLKSETYTRAEVEQLIAAIKQGKFEIVAELPASGDANVIYLVPKSTAQTSNSYDEYVYINNAWEKIGDTDIDLSGYVTDDELTTALQSYLTTSAFNTAIASYYTKTETDNLLANKVDKVAGKGLSTNDYDNTAKGIVDGVTSALNDKVDKVQGKGLSTNDYDNTAKGIVDGVTSALADKVDKVNGKGLSTEDYTTAEKTKLGAISDEANKVTSSSTNGHINIDGVDTTVYNDTAVQTAIENIEDELSTDYATVEGNPINFSTLSAQKSKSTILSVEPIQDLHGYPNPWVGGAGKNLFSGNIEQGTYDNDTSKVPSNVRLRSDDYISVVPSTTYTISFNCAVPNKSLELLIFFYSTKGIKVDQTDSWKSSPYTFTTSENYNYILCIFKFADDSVITPSSIFNTQLELGNQPTDYAPYENLCPITGRTQIGILGCGENLANTVGENTSQGYVSGKFLTSENVETSGYGNGFISEYVVIEPNTTYNLSGITGSSPSLCLYDKYKNFISGISYQNRTAFSFTTPNNAFYIRLSVPESGINSILLNKGNLAITYEPYTKSNDLTISLGQTVYGGTLDVENGVLVVDRAISTFDGSDEQWADSGLSNPSRVVAPRSVNLPNSIANDDKAMSNMLINVEVVQQIVYGGFYIGGTNLVVATEMSLSDWKTYLATNNLQICYKLATPITINLTPHTINLLKGVNNISTDGDKITLIYRDGSVATLGDLTSAVDNLDSKIDESKILTDTVTGDKYILVVTNGVLSVEQISN